MSETPAAEVRSRFRRGEKNLTCLFFFWGGGGKLSQDGPCLCVSMGHTMVCRAVLPVSNFQEYGITSCAALKYFDVEHVDVILGHNVE